MTAARFLCPQCGSVKADAGPKVVRCLNCGFSTRRKDFPTSTDPVASPERHDGRARVAGQVMKCRGAE